MSDSIGIPCPICRMEAMPDGDGYVVCYNCEDAYHANMIHKSRWEVANKELDALRSRVEELERGKNTAYSERDKLVAALSKCYPSVLARHEESDTEWEQNWRWIVFINTPSGQVSWHIHDTELAMFDHLPRTPNNPWDGHTTEEKYTRLERIPYQDTWIGHLQKRVEELERELGYAQDNTKTVSEVLQNTIARRDAEIARLREMVRWIPVGERLPEPDTNVLIFVSDKNVDDSDIQISDYEDRYGWGFLHNEIVTHWMPLPIPPEVK